MYKRRFTILTKRIRKTQTKPKNLFAKCLIASLSVSHPFPLLIPFKNDVVFYSYFFTANFILLPFYFFEKILLISYLLIVTSSCSTINYNLIKFYSNRCMCCSWRRLITSGFLNKSKKELVIKINVNDLFMQKLSFLWCYFIIDLFSNARN